MNPSTILSEIRSWTEKNLRPILARLGKAELEEEISRQEAHLELLAKRCGQIQPVCLLGQAGVGKSTLLNTLIADTQIVVPSGGGTGPLTANALSVRYGESPSFSVRYHSRQKINQLRFIIDSAHQRQTSTSSQAASASTDDFPEDIPDLELDSSEQMSVRLNEAIRSAQLLVAGKQTADRTLPYLSDALREILGNPGRSNSDFSIEDMQRIFGIRDALDYASRNETRHYDGTDPSFSLQLRQHACEFFAPLIAEMAITWPSPMLAEGVEIVDLPGIGIVSDVHAHVTSHYLRNHAKAVILVADSRGLRREDAELLRKSGFLNRLLHCSDDPAADPVVLMVVVVKIDDVAEENWRNDRHVNGSAQKTKPQHFADVVASCSHDIHRQLGQFVRDVWSNEDGTLSAEKEQVIQSLMETLEVFPVSAPQFRLHVADDPDEGHPFLPDRDSTNIPRLREAIVRIAGNHRVNSQAHFEEGTQRFFGLVTPRLEILAAERETNDVSPQVEEMRQALELMVAPLRLEFANRKGAFRNYLRKTVPGQISDKTEVAAARAEREINAYLGTLHDAHWGTLRAAVRREGTYYGARHINLPHDFALRFEEPLAEVWAKGILQGLRKETGEFAEFQEQTVTQILAWAKSRGLRVPKLLDALLMSVKENKKILNSAGREAVDELRARVRQDLIKTIENPIRRRCKKFVDDHADVGAGVKRRILELFAELARKVIEAATEPAKELLRERCKEAEKDILKALKEHSDPIEEACDALLERHEKKLQREAQNAVPAAYIREVIASLEVAFPPEPLKKSA